MSLAFYKVVHLFAAFLLLASLGALCGLTVAGATGSAARRLSLAAHGVALVLLLVAGFGLIARQGFVGGWPLWVWLKLLIWLLFGASLVAVRKAGRSAGWLVWALPALAAVSAWLAIYRIGS